MGCCRFLIKNIPNCMKAFDSPISHQIGATSLTLLDHTAVLIMTRDLRDTYTTSIKTPVFHGRVTMPRSETSIRKQLIKFNIGARGYVGSISQARDTLLCIACAELCRSLLCSISEKTSQSLISSLSLKTPKLTGIVARYVITAGDKPFKPTAPH